MNEDTNKVKNLFEIVRAFRRVYPDSAMIYAHMELKLSRQIKYEWGVGKANNQIALIYLSQHKFDDAYKYFIQAYNAFEKANDLPNKVTVYSNISKVFSTQNIVDSSIKYIYLTRNLNQQLPESVDKTGNEIDALNDLAIVYYGLDILDSVIYYNNQVIDKSNVDEFDEVKGSAYLTNAASYQKLKDYNKAIEFFKFADQLLPEPAYKIQILQGLGMSYYSLNVLDSSIACNQLAMNLCNKYGYDNHMPQVLLNQGLAYLKKNETSKAISSFKDCANNKYTDKIVKSQSHQFCGDAYLKDQKYNQAILQYQMGLSHLDTVHHDRKNQLYTALSECYLLIRQYKLSREALVFAITEEKLFTTEQMLNNIKELEIKHETEMKQEKINGLELDNKIGKLSLEKENQKKKFAYASILGILVLGGTGGYHFIQRKKIESKQTIISERLRMSSELHDEVGSTLSGISMYSHLAKSQVKEENNSLKNSIETIQVSTDEIINKINDIIWMVNPDKDTLQTLRDKLEDYLRKLAAVKNIKVTRGKYKWRNNTYK